MLLRVSKEVWLYCGLAHHIHGTQMDSPYLEGWIYDGVVQLHHLMEDGGAEVGGLAGGDGTMGGSWHQSAVVVDFQGDYGGCHLLLKRRVMISCAVAAVPFPGGAGSAGLVPHCQTESGGHQ